MISKKKYGNILFLSDFAITWCLSSLHCLLTFLIDIHVWILSETRFCRSSFVFFDLQLLITPLFCLLSLVPDVTYVSWLSILNYSFVLFVVSCARCYLCLLIVHSQLLLCFTPRKHSLGGCIGIDLSVRTNFHIFCSISTKLCGI
jgi:hypothetical protein